jgi:hypothetical protein
MKLLALFVLNIYAILGADQACSFTGCLRCGWIPRNG